MEFESFDLWTHPFCLSCDKQTEGAAYCSESCRLADFEKPSATHSYPASPASTMSSSWNHQLANAKFHLSPALDFSKPHVYTRSPYSSSSYSSSSASSPTTAPSWQRSNSYQNTSHYTRNRSRNTSTRSLTPSSSHSSLSSMESSATASRPDNLLVSEKARRELQDYAKQFEHVRSNRRRSY